MLSAVKQLIEGVVPWQTWLDEQTVRAKAVKLARDYAMGDHRASLTNEMKTMLRIANAEAGSPFNINHLDNIIQTMADRLEISEIASDQPDATEWLSGVLRETQFDALQIDVHEAVIRDGDTYVMVHWADDEEGPRLSHEDAYDGVSGVVMVYGTDRQALMALKLWPEILPGEKKSVTRINAYYPDRVEKYVARSAKAIIPFGDPEPPWVVEGKPIGIPIIHFKNRTSRKRTTGRSEIEGAIPLQDAINRTMVSMVMASELTAFKIRYAIGIRPPRALSPGMWIEAYVQSDKGGMGIPNEQQQKWLDGIRFGTLDQGELVPFLSQASFMIEQMYVITRTPRNNAGPDASGESQKQRESPLIGKVRRAQVKFGNAWEAVARLLARVQTAYGVKSAPAAAMWSTRWRNAEIRNDAEVIDNALKVADRVDERTMLSLLAPVFGWDGGQIDAILKAKRGDAGARVAALAGNIQRFGGAGGVGVNEDDEDELEIEPLSA